jgi:hypothetical protein
MSVTRSTFVSALLISNAGSPEPVIHGIEAKVDACEFAALVFSYTLIGDIQRLLIPVAAAPKHVDGLWRHTCFETFIGMKDSPVYYEFNFSPSSEWAAYRFRAYREGAPLGDAAFSPNISVEQAAERLRLTATVRLDHLTLIQPGVTLRIALSAVIEATDGSLSYWALKHPADKPDFHHPDSFVLELALPVESA